MKPKEVHWAKRLYLSVEGYAKNLALVSVAVTPVYLLFSRDKIDFSFLDSFSKQMQSFSSLANTAKAFTDVDNPIIINFAALLTALAGLSKGVYFIVETVGTTIVPFLQTANYAALLTSTLTIATSPLFLLIAGTAIGVCAFGYWMSMDEEQKAPEDIILSKESSTLAPIMPAPTHVNVNVNIPSPTPNQLPLSTPPKATEFNIADIIKQLPSGASIKITTPDGIQMEIAIPLIVAAANASQATKLEQADITVEISK